MGNYIEIQDQLIRLRKKESIGVTTPAKAINEAIEFCKVNNLTECELDYEGFLFDIEPTSDLKEKLSDFNRAMAERTNENSGLHLQNVKTRFVPENLVMKGGAHIMRVDVFEDFRKQPVCRIKCIDDLSCTQDLDGEWVEEIGEGCFYLDVKKIDLVISKLQEAKAFLNGA